MTKTIYLCGPITNMPQLNYPEFRKWADELEKKDYRVIIPHELFKNVDTTSFRWEDYMKLCIPAMLTCDLVATLPDWYNSKGATIEVEIARKLDIPVQIVNKICQWQMN
jgi:hypothetical protein